VDDCLSLWQFRGANEAGVTIQCDGVITAVAIGVPSPHILSREVKFMIVIATENSVSLHGLDSDGKLCKLDQGFFIPVPGKGMATFTQASVTATGRVMLWSSQDPSSLYELRYSAQSSWFRSKVFFHTHSLVLTSGAVGIVSSVLSKLLGSLFLSPRIGSSSTQTESSVKLFIHPDQTFRFFVSIDGSNISLHEMTPSPSGLEISSAAWRLRKDEDLTIRVVGRMAISELPVVSRVLFANVVMSIDSDEPMVSVVTDSGVAYMLRNTESGHLVVDSTVAVSQEIDASKKQRVSFGASSQSVQGTFSFGFESNGIVAAAQGTRLTVANAGEIETNGSVLSVGIERSVEHDSVSSFVLPVFSSGGLAAPTPQHTLVVLTGKGVTILEPPTISPTAKESPSTVQQVVDVLNAKNVATTFAYKPIFTRAISDDVTVASLEDERDYASRESVVQPLKGGVWIGGVRKFSQSFVYVLKHQPMFVAGRIGPSSLVLESIAVKVKNLVKFIHQVVHASGVETAEIPTTLKGYQRREFLESYSRERAAKQQAVVSLVKIAEDLADIGEVIGFFGVFAENQVSLDHLLPLEAGQWTVTDFPRGVLKSLCEALISMNPSSSMASIVEKLRVVSPSILCSVSPAVVPFNPEGIAAMIHCAVAQKSPVQLMLEAVRMLGRNNPSIPKTLSELNQIIRSLPQEDLESKECVIGACLDGLQERLIDESVVISVLAWAGSSLSAALNDFLLSYLFEHGNVSHLPAGAASNAHVERFLVTRLGQDPIYGEVYSEVLVRSGRAQQGADLLERLALSSARNLLEDRIRLLDRSVVMFPAKKRKETLSIAKYIQTPLLESVADEELRYQLLSIADLYEIASENGIHDIVLKCFLFVSGKEQDLIRAWTNVLFSDLRFFTRGGRTVSSGVIEFLQTLYEISVDVESFTVWRRPELIAAMIEYLFCMLGVDSVSVGEEVLVGVIRLSPQQVVEAYVKMLRELNVWSSVIPKVKGAEFVPPHQESLKTHLVNALVELANKHKNEMNRHKLQSLLILAKNYIQRDDLGLNRLIEESETSNVARETLPSLAS
jgi:hypothetical protein